MNRIALKSSEFRAARQASWRELEGLVERAEKRGIRSLSPAELQRLPVLYRAALSSLSVAQSIALDRNLLLYLENLALRGFLSVYGSRFRPWEDTLRFLRRGFPAAVRAVRWHLALALLCTLVGGVAGFMLVTADASWFTALVPQDLSDGRGLASTRDSLLKDEIFAPWPGLLESFLATSNFLFTHNTVVGVVTFSLGVAAGVPTALLLAYQGLILGAFIALHARQGLTLDFIGWLSIHGVTEMTAILLCGAGGLLVGDRILFPGRQSRLDSIAAAGRVAAKIAVGAMLMFFVAGILEGGFRQLVASTPWRLVIGGATGIAWLAYFSNGWRKNRHGR